MLLTNPLPRVVEARALGGFSVWLRFDDNAEGVVDLHDAVEDSNVTALRDERTFAQLRVDFGTLVWPGGIDWAPESLHALLVASNGLQQESIDDARDSYGAQMRAVPEISRFFGIVVRMLYNDHNPHFHATYGDYEVAVMIQSGEVTGRFPKRALRMVLEWQELHERDLMANWERLRSGLPPLEIAPLE